jgi:beta-glucosidase
VSADSFKDVDGVTVTVDVTNMGGVAGKETVQVYVHDVASGLVRPEKELKGFAKVELQPGETKTVSIPLDFRAFAYYHPEYGQWIAEPGEFEILVGASSADIRASRTVTMESTLMLPCMLDRESTIHEWMADRRGKGIVTPVLEQMAARSRRSFGTDSGSEGIGMNIMDMFMDMPLMSVFGFLGSGGDQAPEAVVDEMLAQAHASA